MPRLSPRAALLCLVAPLVFAALQVRGLAYELTWTDESAIGQRTLLRPPGGILAALGEPLHRVEIGGAGRQSYYRPLQVVLLSLVAAASDDDPRALRAASIAVGALALACFTGFARRLLRRDDLAVFAALVPAVHPFAIESSVWIAGASGALCALFTVLALAAGLACATAAPGARRWGLAAASLVALAAALLSKERAAVEPGLLALTLLCADRGVASEARRPAPAHAAALVAAHAAWVALHFGVGRPLVVGRSLVGVPPIGGSHATQLATAIATWPAELARLAGLLPPRTSDVVRIVQPGADAWLLLGLGLALGSAAGAVWLWRRGRGIAALGLAWIWLAWLPTAGLVPMLHARGDRYLYLSSFGAGLLLAGLAPARARSPALRRIAPVAAAVVLAALTWRTWTRLPDWRSTETLFGGEVAAEPAYREGHFLLAAAHHRARQYERAERELALLLDEPAAFAGTASYLNWTSVYDLACANRLALGRHEEVVALGRDLAARMPEVLSLPGLRTCVGRAHAALGHREEALRLYRSVAEDLGEATPPLLLLMLARGELEAGRRPEAGRWLDAAERAAGGDPDMATRIARLRARVSPPRLRTPRGR